MTDLGTTIELDYDVTLADQLCFTEWLLRRPSWRLKRLLRRAAFVLLVPPSSILLGVTVISVQEHKAFVVALHEAVIDPAAYQIIVELAGVLLLYIAGERLIRRPMLRRRLRKLLLERPGIDPADPTLSERVHIAAGPHGCRFTGAATTTELGWRAVRSLDDAGTVLALMTGGLSGHLIPKRALSEAQIDGLEAIVQANLGAGRVLGKPGPAAAPTPS